MTRLPKDTVRFEAPATANRCGRATLGLLLHGSDAGNGVMIWLRPGDSLVRGELSLLPRADSVATRGATVTVRFLLGEVTHGATLDSGAVVVTRAEGPVTLRARGSGVDVGAGGSAGRVGLDASFESVPVGPDTVTCTVRR